MKRERFLPAFLIGFFCLLALSSCVSESFLSERVSIKPPQTDRPEAVMLWKQMQEQPGSAERLGRALHKNTPLYEHTITASSPDFGVYYLIPYTDDKNEVKGCLIYPVDEDKPLEERDITGTLGMPVKMDAEFLQTEIPADRRYLYAWVFRDLRDQGLQVDAVLLQVALDLEKNDNDTDKTRTTNSSNLVERATINFIYQVSSYGSLTPTGYPTVTSVSKETIMTVIKDTYTWHSINGVNVIFEQIIDSGFHACTLKISFRRPVPYDDIVRDLRIQLNNIGVFFKSQYSVDIMFQCQYFMDYANTGGSGSGSTVGGSKSPDTGVDYGGYDPYSPTTSKPCRNDVKGKANPLIYMCLMPPKDSNIKGARFGYTRVNEYGEKKFHQGIDLAAEPGTPVYALFSGKIVGPYVTEQPNKNSDGDYPSDYNGDTNGAGNRFGVQSKVNGKTITVYYWHLQAEQPIALKGGKPLKVGDYVQAGTIIGYTGITGNASQYRPHLHLGIKDETGNWINPELYLNATVKDDTIIITTPCDPYY